MPTEQVQAAEARKPPLEDFDATDESVTEALIRKLPEALRVAFAGNVRAIALEAILRERRRCALRLEACVALHADRIAQCEDAIMQASAAGDVRGAERVGQARFLEADRAATIRAVQRAIEVPPGSCTGCCGSGVVASALAQADGSPTVQPCPACQVQAAAEEQPS